MQHPLEFIPHNLRRPFFYVFLVLTIVILGVFNMLDRSLRTTAAPNGIVSFELAGTPEKAHEIMLSWEYRKDAFLDLPQFIDQYVPPVLYATFGLGFDYLFMPVYALALSLGLLLAGSQKTGWYKSLAAAMGWGIFAAALFDAVENFALWNVLTHEIISPYPQIAAICAAIKFALLLMGAAIIVIGQGIRN